MRQMLKEVISEPMTDKQQDLCDSIFVMMSNTGILAKVDKFPETKIEAQEFIGLWYEWYLNMLDLEDCCV